MGLIAAGDKSYELAQQGVGAGEALGRSAIKSILEQMALEGTEEAVSYVANYAADKAASDPNAKFSLKELVGSAASGALSGGILGGAGAAISRVSAPVTRVQDGVQIENPAQQCAGGFLFGGDGGILPAG